MQMTTLKAHRYGKQRKPGDEYEAKASDVRLIKALGWAKESPPKPEPTAAAPSAIAEQAPTPRVKRTYRRRDMTAQPD